jgi:ribosomal protein S18 acetylase RimI-like enzyme
MIFFIFGASGSGKSTLLPILKNNKLDIEFHDFDDIGVPSNADKIWRQKSTHTWIEKALKSKKSVCILGGSVPGEIISTPAYLKNNPQIKFLLLDCDDAVRYERLNQRQSYGPNQDIMNWASWLRLHTHNPQWEQSVFLDDAWSEMDFSAFKNLNSWHDSFNFEMINNRNDTPEDTTTRVLEWIAFAQKHKTQQHILQLATLPDWIEKEMSDDLISFEKKHGIDVNYQKSHLALFDDKENIIGILSYFTCFSEVYIDDLWIHNQYRNKGYGRRLILDLETRFTGKGFNNINCCTSSFQAPDFYQKCGFKLEFTRVNQHNPKLSKHFFVKFFEDTIQQQGTIQSKV